MCEGQGRRRVKCKHRRGKWFPSNTPTVCVCVRFRHPPTARKRDNRINLFFFLLHVDHRLQVGPMHWHEGKKGHGCDHGCAKVQNTARLPDENSVRGAEQRGVKKKKILNFARRINIVAHRGSETKPRIQTEDRTPPGGGRKV